MHAAIRPIPGSGFSPPDRLKLLRIIHSPMVLMLFSLVTFQIGISLTKGAFDFVSAPAVSFLRQAFGAAILFAVFRPKIRGLGARQWGAVIGMGGSTALMSLLYFLALDRVPLGIATAITFSGPCLLALAGTRHRGQAVWVMIAIIGVALLAPWGTASIDLMGYAIAGLAGFSYSAFIVIADRGGPLLPANSALPLSLGCSAVLLAPVGAASAGADMIDGSLLLIIRLTSLLSTVIPNLLEFYIIRRITASLHGVLVTLNPAVGSIAGAVVLSESIGPLGLLAIACICTGVVMAHRAAHHRVAPGSNRSLSEAGA